MKLFIFKNYTLIKTLFIATGFSLILLMLRIKLTHEAYLLFLIWNLFLAFLPLLFSWMISLKRKKYQNLILGFLWLLFLPNAPYILTDFIHLQYSPEGFMVFDALTIAIFALTGLIMGMVSVQKIIRFITPFVNSSWIGFFVLTVNFLCALGIYLGRILRYNSWDVLTKPDMLISDMISLFINPLQNYHIWIFVIIMSLILHIFYNICCIFAKNKLLCYAKKK
ncbi:MAG: hypothetical protein CL868_14615 [Cytophagaceae bacterium]|nr:hypothetical protein [Cytophagaceae bacterium]|tara:strand:+ start:1008 stop:1676 length:669 start_codon:yes stop_codon:yes gene_type:complete